VISEQTVKSCLIDKNLCHPNAVCTIEGICRCGKNLCFSFKFHLL
jgi:hypothetical protein